MPDSEDQEDELMALSSIYEERVFVAAENKKEGQFAVNVVLPEKFCVKLEDPTALGVALKSGVKPVKEDGADLLLLSYLPPIIIFFQYPDDYPSVNAPRFTVSCKWLSPKQISHLCSHLDELWEENKGEVILFQWIQFLQDESFSFLGLEVPLQLDYSYVKSFTRSVSKKDEKDEESTKVNETAVSSSSESDERMAANAGIVCGKGAYAARGDDRAVQDVASVTNLIHSLIQHNLEEKQRAFDAGFYHCQICFEEKMGSECLSYPHCGHTYCKDCLTEYFNVQITEGNVKALCCPEPKCDSQASQSQVRSLVSEETFARYDRLLLQMSLDGMEDVTSCPRTSCQCPVLKEENSTMAVCPSCHFAFCALCNMAYHGVSPCRLRKADIRKLKEEYSNGDEMTKEFLEKKYGRKVIRRILEDSYSEMWIDKHSRKCPACSSNIQKIDGCNKMTCGKCHAYFCWICMKVLSKMNPYEHFKDFNSPCQNLLFLGLEERGRNEDEEDDDYPEIGDNWFQDDNLEQFLFYL